MLWMGLVSEQKKDFDTAVEWYQKAAALEAGGAYDRWAELLVSMPVTAQSLATLHAFVTQNVGLDTEVEKLILAQDYLNILGLEDAKFLQTKLTQQGFDTGGIDGSIGSKSKKALAAFRVSRGRANASILVLSILDLKDLGFF